MCNSSWEPLQAAGPLNSERTTPPEEGQLKNSTGDIRPERNSSKGNRGEEDREQKADSTADDSDIDVSDNDGDNIENDGSEVEEDWGLWDWSWKLSKKMTEDYLLKNLPHTFACTIASMPLSCRSFMQKVVFSHALSPLAFVLNVTMLHFIVLVLANKQPLIVHLSCIVLLPLDIIPA